MSFSFLLLQDSGGGGGAAAGPISIHDVALNVLDVQIPDMGLGVSYTALADIVILDTQLQVEIISPDEDIDL